MQAKHSHSRHKSVFKNKPRMMIIRWVGTEILAALVLPKVLGTLREQDQERLVRPVDSC